MLIQGSFTLAPFLPAPILIRISKRISNRTQINTFGDADRNPLSKRISNRTQSSAFGDADRNPLSKRMSDFCWRCSVTMICVCLFRLRYTAKGTMTLLIITCRHTVISMQTRVCVISFKQFARIACLNSPIALYRRIEISLPFQLYISRLI